MFRFYFIISMSVLAAAYFFSIAYMMKKFPNSFSDQQKFNLVLFACKQVRLKGRISNVIDGTDNLPTDGGYIMYANHQGRYDALGVLHAHKTPCSFVIDKTRSQVLLLNQITNLLRAQRLDKSDMKNQIQVIRAVANEVKTGRRYLIFPEGGYGDHVVNNDLHDFMPGSFKAATMARCPIVPIAIVDSYKVFLENNLKRVKPEIHFLEPIPYDEYKELNTQEISN